MKKNKEQLELLVVMQKHKISELRTIYSTVAMTQTRLGVTVCNTHATYCLKDRIAKAKMKLNHYKQLLGNFKEAPVVGKPEILD